jgi:hypothetical protein
MKFRGILVVLAVVSVSILASRASVGAAAVSANADRTTERSVLASQDDRGDGNVLTMGAIDLASAMAVSSTAGVDTSGDADVLQAASAQAISSSLPTPAPVAATPAPVVAATARIPAPARTAAPAPTVAPAPTLAPTPIPAATVATCPKDWFCYPRLGIAGPIVPYTDCSGSTDVGTAIRSYTCLSDYYLMGHAYTQFGLVRQWIAGDVVFAWGRQFTVYAALTEQSCASPVFPLAPLSMQTSLTSSSCGAVLVVQAR